MRMQIGPCCLVQDKIFFWILSLRRRHQGLIWIKTKQYLNGGHFGIRCISLHAQFYCNHLYIIFQGVSQERIEIDPVLQPKAAKKFWGKQKFVSIYRNGKRQAGDDGLVWTKLLLLLIRFTVNMLLDYYQKGDNNFETASQVLAHKTGLKLRA